MAGPANSPDPIVDPLAGSLAFHLRRTAVAVAANLSAQLAETGLNPGEATFLRLVGANPGRTQAAIADALNAKPANVVPLVATLEARGLLSRRKGHGRSLALSLTVDGEGMLKQVEAAFERHELAVAGSFPADKKEALVAALVQMVHNCCADHPVPGD